MLAERAAGDRMPARMIKRVEATLPNEGPLTSSTHITSPALVKCFWLAGPFGTGTIRLAHNDCS